MWRLVQTADGLGEAAGAALVMEPRALEGRDMEPEVSTGRPSAPTGPTQGAALTEESAAQLLGQHLAMVEARLGAWARTLLDLHLDGTAANLPIPAGDQLVPVVSATPVVSEAMHRYAGAVLIATLSADDLVGFVKPAASATPGDGMYPGRDVLHSSRIALDAPCLLAVRVNLDAPATDAQPVAMLRVVVQGRQQSGPAFACRHGVTEACVYITSATRDVAITLGGFLKERPGFRIRRIDLLRLDPEAWRAAVAVDVGAPVVASLSAGAGTETALSDAVESLLLQCDRVRVFLNDLDDLPAALRHDRVELRRSCDYDRLGEAGRFAWLDDLDPPGYRLFLDGRLAYPPDFVTAMVAGCRRYNDQAVLGLSAALLRYPCGGPAVSWRASDALADDRGVHLLSVGTLCAHSAALTLSRAELAHPGALDVLFAIAAQRRGLPLIALARPADWVSGAAGAEAPLVDAALPAALIRGSASMTVQSTSRPKLVFCLFASDAASASAALDSWGATAEAGCDWIVIVCPIADAQPLLAWTAALRLPWELHVLSSAKSALIRMGDALCLARRLGGDVVWIASDSIRFTGRGWHTPVLASVGKASAAALFFHVADDGRISVTQSAALPGAPSPVLAVASHALVLATGDIAQDAASASAGLAEWMTRLCLAQSRSKSGHIAALSDLSHLLRAQGTLVDGVPDGPACRGRVGWLRPPARRGDVVTVNAAFDLVQVINLDRRSDRWAALQARLDRAGIRAERVLAVDGQSPAVAEAYAAYATLPVVTPPKGVRAVRTSWQFSRDYDSQRARVAFEEGRAGRKAIGSAGAWAYLLTWEGILEQAIERNVDALLVLDDDVAFHRDIHTFFDAALRELPDDWLVLQLGALQYNWNSEALTRVSRHLYSPDGAAVGSHAVALRAPILPFLLALVQRRELPFDIGALAAATLSFRSSCFVTLPNLAIQVLGDTDIGTSAFQAGRSVAELAAAYHWHLPDYDI